MSVSRIWRATYSRIAGVCVPSPWYGTWRNTIGQRYSSRRSSNHFMNV